MDPLNRRDWKVFFVRLYYKTDTTDIFNRAALVAFYFSFAFFPLLLFLVSLAGLILNTTESLQRDLYSYLYQILPRTAYTLVRATLDEVIENSSGGKVTVSLFITLWSASAGVDSLRSSLNAVYERRESRPWWKTKLQSLMFTFLFIFLLLIGMIAVSAGLDGIDHLMGFVGLSIDSPALRVTVQWLAVLLLLLFTCEIIYNLLPCHKTFYWFWATPGSTVAIILWVLLSGGFRLYLQYFNTYNKAYGSLGAVIILMLWMFLTGTAILLGASINAVLMEMADVKEDEEAGPEGPHADDELINPS